MSWAVTSTTVFSQPERLCRGDWPPTLRLVQSPQETATCRFADAARAFASGRRCRSNRRRRSRTRRPEHRQRHAGGRSHPTRCAAGPPPHRAIPDVAHTVELARTDVVQRAAPARNAPNSRRHHPHARNQRSRLQHKSVREIVGQCLAVDDRAARGQRPAADELPRQRRFL